MSGTHVGVPEDASLLTFLHSWQVGCIGVSVIGGAILLSVCAMSWKVGQEITQAYDDRTQGKALDSFMKLDLLLLYLRTDAHPGH